MKLATEDVISDLSERVFGISIPILWKSQEPLPGAGERRSQSRGADGDEIISRQKYEVGDDPRNIDHFATAQSGDDSIITITRQEPRDIRIEALVDVGWTMQFGTRLDKRTLSAQLTASILACANKTLDPAKVSTFSESRVESGIGPRGAKTIFSSALHAILEPPQPVVVESGQDGWLALVKSLFGIADKSSGREAGGDNGMREALSRLGRRKSLVFVVSDFINLTDEGKQALQDAAAFHDVICVVIRDQRELELPPGRLCTLRDIVTGETKTVWLNEATRALFRENARKKLAELGAFFQEANCELGVFSTEQDAVETIPLMMQLFGGHRR